MTSESSPSIALPQVVLRALVAAVAIGIVSFGVGLSVDSKRAWADMLMACYFVLELSLAECTAAHRKNTTDTTRYSRTGGR